MMFATKDGLRKATPAEEAKELLFQEKYNGKAKLKAALSKATSLQAEVDAIKEYIGV